MPFEVSNEATFHGQNTLQVPNDVTRTTQAIEKGATNVTLVWKVSDNFKPRWDSGGRIHSDTELFHYNATSEMMLNYHSMDIPRGL